MSNSESRWAEALDSPESDHARGETASESAITREYTEQSIRGEGSREPGAYAVDARAADVDRLLNQARADWRETLDILANCTNRGRWLSLCVAVA